MTIEGVYPLQLTRVKATLLVCEDKLILVDTGRSAEDAETILRFARKHLHMPLEKYGEICIITHRHRDHIGGLEMLKDCCNFKIASHVDEAKDLESALGFKVDLKLGDGEILPYCGGIQFIHVPGHTVGNLCLYLKDKSLLIVGDTVFADEDGALMAPPDRYCIDAAQAKRELKRLKELDFDSMILCHGKDSFKDAKQKLERIIASS